MHNLEHLSEKSLLALKTAIDGAIRFEKEPDVVEYFRKIVNALARTSSGEISLWKLRDLLNREDERRSRHQTLQLRDDLFVEGILSTLGRRELQVLELIGEGYTSKGIAQRLGISVHTVANHKQNIKRKADLDSVADLGRWVIEILADHKREKPETD